ncbi:hypothetical protein F8388_023715 [Cannabis sativa]|uniref:Uncharacterized protein n=1 Tax=Cannabis sativa TaxID=3483 RepID=A0A7J6GA42_CANSA|nr:hypothetical protein F8388_023715 [Cannabis sativa]KAF4388675.1 hypothetical protein G4B88_018952 [Cannabis sativa]
MFKQSGSETSIPGILQLAIAFMSLRESRDIFCKFCIKDVLIADNEKSHYQGYKMNMDMMIKTLQKRFKKVRDEMERWEELQSRLVSQFSNAASIIGRLEVLKDIKNYGNLSCIDGIQEAVLNKQMDSLQNIFLLMKDTLEELHGITLSLGKIHRDARQLIEGGSNQLGSKQLHLQIGVKPTLAYCLDGLKQLHEMHQSEYNLKTSLFSGLSVLTLKPNPNDLSTLQQLLIDQPNIPKEEVETLFQNIFAEDD